VIPEIVVEAVAAVWILGGWLLYLRERSRSRDYVADLAQLIHDHDLGREDLRRSLGWDEVDDLVDGLGSGEQ